MKKYNNLCCLLFLVLIPFAVFFFNSCSKDEIKYQCEEFRFYGNNPSTEFPSTGGTNEYRFISTGREKGSSEGSATVPLSWKIDFFELDEENDNEPHQIEKPNWITDITLNGGGEEDVSTIRISVAPQTPKVTNLDSILRNTQPVNGLYDLSTNGGTKSQNTANCYVINAAGKYCLPLVYGNAIKDGNINESSYKSSKTGDYVLNNFIDYKGEDISSPYIYDKYSPSSASIVWQDSQNLISNVKLSSDKRELYFDVDKSSIKQGNAVIAVMDSDNIIMWSWHIWVTPYKLGENDVLLDRDQEFNPGVPHAFMPIILGWNDHGSSYCPENVVELRFTQVESGTTMFITISRAACGSPAYSATYYQWGRKDPMISYDCVNNKNYTYYLSDGSSSDITPQLMTNDDDNVIPLEIQNPLSMTGQAYDKHINLWNCVNDRFDVKIEDAVKTIYDPCPVGYIVPPASWYSLKFSLGCIPSLNSFAHYSGNEIVTLFPALGRKQVSPELIINCNKSGLFWTSSTSNRKNFNWWSYVLKLDITNSTEHYPNYVNVSLDEFRSYGCNILPFVDQ